jgi:hypothetical protein
LPDACVGLGESCLGLLKSELNVKEIVIFDNPEDIAVLRGVPDARKLGPVYGREMQAIICAAREGKLQRNTEKGTVSVFGHSKTWELDESEIDIGYQGKQGMDVISDGGILVGLNPEITPALREEGVVNELNRCIQDLRKEAGYTVSDRILLDIHGALSDQQLQQLADSAFADLAPLDENSADAHNRITVDERSFFVAVCKVWVGP